MAERHPSRPWSEEEDALLTNAVHVHGEHENWKTVARLVPGRTNKACRKRWLHSLSPTIKKSAWTSTEDELLLSLYSIHSGKWSVIAREIPGRTDDACSKRYREALDPNLKKNEWTPEEDKKLIDLYAQNGGKWGQLGQELQRSGLGCRNRYRLLSKKASKAVYHPAPFDTPPPPRPTQDVLSPPQGLDFSDWAPEYPYYPPEAYPCFIAEDGPNMCSSFRDPTPDVLIVTPDKAPFQFSSSSLSAALSDMPQKSRSLPTIYEGEQSTSSMAPISENQTIHRDMQTPQADFTLHFDQEQDLSRIFLGVHFSENDVLDYLEGQNNSLILPDGLIPDSEGDPWECSLPDLFPSPASISVPLQGLDVPRDRSGPESMSSTLSTPFNFSLSLSDPSTPNLSSPIDLPAHEQPSNSLAFLPKRRSQRTRRRRAKKMDKLEKPHRLSSSLTLTSDSSVRPYACGRDSCWPSNAIVSSSCFATSRQLFEHGKIDHARDSPGDRPFRCGLTGCGKSWKSLNGLQYHLQLSTAHFRAAVSSTFSSQAPTGSNTGVSSSLSDSDSDTESNEGNKRTYVCHHPQCFKAYRQPSGLRYHLKHGHAKEQPTQLSMVPPALARQLPSKTRKMRRKATEGDA